MSKLIYKATFTFEDATAPNPHDKEFQVIDSFGDRLAYVDSIEEAKTDVDQFVDPDGTLDGDVEEES